MNNAEPLQLKQHDPFIKSKEIAAELEQNCSQERTKSAPSVPQPLQRESAPPKPYPFTALGPILGAAAQQIHDVVQAPDATCGQSLLAALSLACQPFISVRMDGRLYPSSLFLLTVSESGERKSATDKIALKPLHEWQKLLIDKQKHEFETYKNKFEIWKAQRNHILQKAKEPLQNQVTLEVEPQPPCEGLMICEEPTLEGLEQLLERGQPSAGIFSDEGGRLVGGHALNSDNALKTACGLSNLWDGKPWTRVRKSERSKILYGRRLSMHLMIQPIVLTQLLKNEMLVGQGLLSRCLFSAPAPRAGTRKYREVDLNKDSSIIAFYGLINSILDRPYPKNESSLTPSNEFRPDDALEPKQIELEVRAKLRWIEFHDYIEEKLVVDGEFYPIKGFASKASEQVLRIATLFAFSENLNTAAKEVALPYVNRAIELMEYYLGEALRVLGKHADDPEMTLATQVLEWIKRNRPQQIFPLADVYQRGPTQVRGVKTAKKMLLLLAEHGHVSEIKDAILGEKKVKSAWKLNEEC